MPRNPERQPSGSPEIDPVGELANVVLVGWPSTTTASLMDLVQDVAPHAAVQRARKDALTFSRTLPAGSMLLVSERLGKESGLEFLAQLRSNGVQAPAIVLGSGDEPETPEGLAVVSAVEFIPLASFSKFSFRRALESFAQAAMQEKLIEEMSSRFRAYERVLESKDDERLRVLQVASALERRLTETEQELEQLEQELEQDHPADEGPAAGGPRPEHEDDPDASELLDLWGEGAGAEVSPPAGTEVLPPDDLADGGRVERLEAEVASLREERARQAQKLSELRKHGITRERELRRLMAQSAAAGDLATRLEASERIRRTQTREMLNQQQVISELEQKIETLVELLHAEQEPGDTAKEVLAELRSRVEHFERLREQQQSTIDQLSRTLAAQQVDDVLDNAQSRRNALYRVEEATRHSRRTGAPLTCMMIGIDRPGAIRAEHGSVLYDYMLVQLAQRLQLALRHRDVLLRYSDETFVLLTDAGSERHAHPHAERLLHSACDEPLDLGPQSVRPGLSIAILAFRPEMSGAGELIRRTQRMLVEAQNEGQRQIALGPEIADAAYDEETVVELPLDEFLDEVREEVAGAASAPDADGEVGLGTDEEIEIDLELEDEDEDEDEFEDGDEAAAGSQIDADPHGGAQRDDGLDPTEKLEFDPHERLELAQVAERQAEEDEAVEEEEAREEEDTGTVEPILFP